MTKRVIKLLKKLCLLNLVTAVLVCLCCGNTFAMKQIVITVVGDSAAGKSTICSSVSGTKGCDGGNKDRQIETDLSFGSAPGAETVHTFMRDVEGYAPAKGEGIDQKMSRMMSLIKGHADATDIYVVVIDTSKGTDMEEGWGCVSTCATDWIGAISEVYKGSEQHKKGHALNVVLVFTQQDKVDDDEPVFNPQHGHVPEFFAHFLSMCNMFSVPGRKKVVPVFGSSSPDSQNPSNPPTRDYFSLDGTVSGYVTFRAILTDLLPQFYASTSFLDVYSSVQSMFTCCVCRKTLPASMFSPKERLLKDPHCQKCPRSGWRCVIM